VFERFTDRARQVMVLAQEEARALGHNWIGTEHLLLGLIREQQGLAAQLLKSLGVPIEEARARVAREVPQADKGIAAHHQIPFTPRAKKVLELSLREALSLGHDWIGTEHILLGLVRENEGVAARVLLDFGADAETIRDGVISMLSGGRPPACAGGPGVEIHLRRVIPVARQLSDGTWIVSVEVWEHGVTLRWAKSVRPAPTPLRGMGGGWHVSDDAGTKFTRVADSASGGPQRGFHGDIKFEPAPPPEATSLLIRRDGVDDEFLITLAD
jgi:Clp amino terminal domain, pathogenicity island component